MPPAERLQSLLRGLEDPHLRTHGERRTLVGFPEKPLAVENDPVGVGRLGANEILTRHRLNRFRTEKKKGFRARPAPGRVRPTICLLHSGPRNRHRKPEKFFDRLTPVIQPSGFQCPTVKIECGRWRSLTILGRSAQGSRSHGYYYSAGSRTRRRKSSCLRSQNSESATTTSCNRRTRHTPARRTRGRDSPKRDRSRYSPNANPDRRRSNHAE